MSRTLDEVGLRIAADVFVALDFVASVGAAGAVIFDCILLLETRVSNCARRTPPTPHTAQDTTDAPARGAARGGADRLRNHQRLALALA